MKTIFIAVILSVLTTYFTACIATDTEHKDASDTDPKLYLKLEYWDGGTADTGINIR